MKTKATFFGLCFALFFFASPDILADAWTKSRNKCNWLGKRYKASCWRRQCSPPYDENQNFDKDCNMVFVNVKWPRRNQEKPGVVYPSIYSRAYGFIGGPITITDGSFTVPYWDYGGSSRFIRENSDP